MVLAATGCRSPESYRDEADTVAEDILRDKQTEAFGKVDKKAFDIMSPADTLRRRLLLSQGLPIVGPEAFGVSALDEIEYWPQDDYLTAMAGSSDNLSPEMIGELQSAADISSGSAYGSEPANSDDTDAPQVLTLSLDGALIVAAASSRNYQSQKEDLFRTALSLDLERHDFRTTFSGMYQALLSGEADKGDGKPGADLTNSAEVGLRRNFENGAALTSNLAFDLAQILGAAGSTSSAVNFDASIAIPLMRGSGAHIVTEPLIQADRNVLYALWRFERFKRTFAVSIASEYISVLQQQDRVRNAAQNYRSLIETKERAAANQEAGRMDSVEYGQAVQNMLSARSRWINDIQSYERSLDDFKVTLGLPPDATVFLQPKELQRLDEEVKTQISLEVSGDVDVARDQQGQIILPPQTNEGAGPMELPTRDAILLAFRNRLDLQTAIGEVFDAQRNVVVTSDGFLPELSLLGRVSVGGSRGSGSGSLDDVALDLDTARYSALISLDLPFDRVSERNRYRNALISLERSIRELQDLEDSIKADVINLLRGLALAREQVRVQAESVRVAEKRKDQTDLSFQLGRNIQIRDVTEAEEDLVNARNNLTNALVAYRIAEWRLQRDTGILQVASDGLWTPLDTDRLNELVNEAITQAFDPNQKQDPAAASS